MESSGLSPRVSNKPLSPNSNSQEIKEIIRKGKLMSVSGKRMCQLDKNISDEIDKISKCDILELKIKGDKDLNDELNEHHLAKLFKKTQGTKQSIKDVLKRINDKNIKGITLGVPKDTEISLQNLLKENKNSIFNCVSREKRIQTIDPKIDSPPVGYYSPNYSLFDYKRGSDLRFGKFKTKNEDNINDSPKKICTKSNFIKQDSKINDTKDEYDEFVKTPRYLQRVSDAIQKNKYGNEDESVGRVLLKSLSPNKEQNTSRLLFDKQLSRNDITTWLNSPHESRFELKNNFPEIVSKNKKIVKDIKLDKYSPRKELFKTQSHNAPQYSPNYNFTKTVTHILPFGNQSKVRLRKECMLTSSIDTRREDNDPIEISNQDDRMILEMFNKLNSNLTNSKILNEQNKSYDDYSIDDFTITH